MKDNIRDAMNHLVSCSYIIKELKNPSTHLTSDETDLLGIAHDFKEELEEITQVWERLSAMLRILEGMERR